MGFFLPMPPVSGGATEKTWHRLAAELALRGHSVTIVSRQWPEWPAEETVAGVRHLRLPGFKHRRRLSANLALDLVWSCRVHRQLPDADIAIVHAVTLPVWLGKLRPRAGRVVVMPGRMPKGQYRQYRRIARVIATSTPVRDRVIAENPSLEPFTRVMGYPIDWQSLSRPRRAPSRPVCIGYIGRLHPEKGIDVLVDAVLRLKRDSSLPAWRFILCGPSAVSAGGGGEVYRARIEQRLRAELTPNLWESRAPTFDPEQLGDMYRELDIFCYPSLATEGETFGVAVAEAMAAGAVPVVSALACFRDFVQPDRNGMIFDHTAPDAAVRLADALAVLLRNPERRNGLAHAAQHDVARYDFSRYAETLHDDLLTLAAAPNGGLR